VGCYVGKFFVGTLAYADDIVLLAPTYLPMWKLIQICEQYAQEYSITFNAKKSKCTVAAPAIAIIFCWVSTFVLLLLMAAQLNLSIPSHILDILLVQCQVIMKTYLTGDASLLDTPIVFYVTFGTLVQIGNIGCLNLFAVICMVVSCGI